MNFVRGLFPIVLILTAAAAAPAMAQEIKPGRWQYTMQMDASAMPQIPPDKLAQMPPEARARIEQMMKGRLGGYSSCITADHPVPQNPRQGDCQMTRMDRNGGTVDVAGSCTGKDGKTTSMEATIVYSGDTMSMDMTIHADRNGAPMTMKQHIDGKYLGPCT
jgi:hypothetical protein